MRLFRAYSELCCVSVQLNISFTGHKHLVQYQALLHLVKDLVEWYWMLVKVPRLLTFLGIAPLKQTRL